MPRTYLAIAISVLISTTSAIAKPQKIKVFFDRQNIQSSTDKLCGLKSSEDILLVDDLFSLPLLKRLQYLHNYHDCIPSWYGADQKKMAKTPEFEGWKRDINPVKRTVTYTKDTDTRTVVEVWKNLSSQLSDRSEVLFTYLYEDYNYPENYTTSCKLTTNQLNSYTTILPNDLAKLYDFPENLGRGNVIGILTDGNEGDAAAYNQDILSSYVQGQHSSPISPIKIGEVNQEPNNNGEADLDLSVIASVVPEAEIIMIANDQQYGYFLYDIFEEAIHYGRNQNSEERPINIISSSYGDPDFFGDYNPQKAKIFALLMEDAALRNITVIAASGDRGSAGYNENGLFGYYIDASAPYQLSVGGTSFSTALQNAISSDYDLESLMSLLKKGNNEVWNENSCPYIHGSRDGDKDFNDNRSSSGGVALSFSKPFYQSNVVDGPYRNYPDVSFLGGGSVYYQTFDNSGASGTSASAPLMASLVARINTALFSDEISQHKSLGFINKIIYDAYQNDKDIFIDTQRGHNCQLWNDSSNHSQCFNWPDPPYHARKGYDLATGLGEVLGKPLLNFIQQQISN